MVRSALADALGKEPRMIRTYARLAAVVLLAAALAGLVVLGWGTGEVFYHLGLGLLFGHAGFWQRDANAVRLMVGGLGLLVTAIKAAEFLGMWLLPARSLHLDPHQLTCAAVGITAILAARYLPDDGPGAQR